MLSDVVYDSAADSERCVGFKLRPARGVERIYCVNQRKHALVHDIVNLAELYVHISERKSNRADKPHTLHNYLVSQADIPALVILLYESGN